MEFRATITVPCFPVEDENRPGFELLEWLDTHSDVSPVMAGPDPHNPATFVLATDANNEATATRVLVSALCEALIAVGLDWLYPTRIEIEVAAAPQSELAADEKPSRPMGRTTPWREIRAKRTELDRARPSQNPPPRSS